MPHRGSNGFEVCVWPSNCDMIQEEPPYTMEPGRYRENASGSGVTFKLEVCLGCPFLLSLDPAHKEQHHMSCPAGSDV